MDSPFSIHHLSKTEPSLTRNPKSLKFYLKTCQEKITRETPTSEPWLRIVKLLKLDTTDYDKSRILLGALETHGEIVVKVGDTPHITREYMMSHTLQNIKGYVKYICYFECNDDFRSIPSKSRDTLCKGPGTQMKVILMPYFPLGNIQGYEWTNENIHILHSCFKHALLSMIYVFQTKHIRHGDFHSGNILLKKTKQASISYSIPGIGDFPTMELHGIRPWIMDFENSSVVKMESNYDRIMALTYFYADIGSLFNSLQGRSYKINPRTVSPVIIFYNKLNMKGNMITHPELLKMFSHIDEIRCFEPEARMV